MSEIKNFLIDTFNRQSFITNTQNTINELLNPDITIGETGAVKHEDLRNLLISHYNAKLEYTPAETNESVILSTPVYNSYGTKGLLSDILKVRLVGYEATEINPDTGLSEQKFYVSNPRISINIHKNLPPGDVYIHAGHTIMMDDTTENTNYRIIFDKNDEFLLKLYCKYHDKDIIDYENSLLPYYTTNFPLSYFNLLTRLPASITTSSFILLTSTNPGDNEEYVIRSTNDYHRFFHLFMHDEKTCVLYRHYKTTDGTPIQAFVGLVDYRESTDNVNIKLPLLTYPNTSYEDFINLQDASLLKYDNSNPYANNPGSQEVNAVMKVSNEDKLVPIISNPCLVDPDDEIIDPTTLPSTDKYLVFKDINNQIAYKIPFFFRIGKLVEAIPQGTNRVKTNSTYKTDRLFWMWSGSASSPQIGKACFSLTENWTGMNYKTLFLTSIISAFDLFARTNDGTQAYGYIEATPYIIYDSNFPTDVSGVNLDTLTTDYLVSKRQVHRFYTDAAAGSNPCDVEIWWSVPEGGRQLHFAYYIDVPNIDTIYGIYLEYNFSWKDTTGNLEFRFTHATSWGDGGNLFLIQAT